jgi:hypothetical protein
MSSDMIIPIAVAVIAAITSVGATLVTVRSSRSLRHIEEQFKRQQESAQFLNERLGKLYLPVSMHLSATRILANTHYGADEHTIEEIEHALNYHNKAIIDSLMNWTVYLDPDAPESASTGLLQHLLQWQTVYKLKYEYKQWDKPVWDGLRFFQYSQFPDGADVFFHQRTTELRQLLHNRLDSLP